MGILSNIKNKRRSIKLLEASCPPFALLVVLDPAVLGTEPFVLAGAIPAAGILPQTRVFLWLGRLEGYHLVAPWSLAEANLSRAVMSHIICRYMAPTKDLKPYPLRNPSASW